MMRISGPIQTYLITSAVSAVAVLTVPGAFRLRGCKHDKPFLGTYLSYVLRLLQRGGMPAINPILASRYLYRAKGKGCCIEKCLKYVQRLKFYQLLEVSLVARNLINYVKFYHCSKFRQVLKSLRRRQS